MPLTPVAASPKVESRADLSRALGASGEEEYASLLRVLRAAQGRFTLLPLESDFRPALRDVFLERLRADLEPTGVALRVARLSRQEWDVMACLEVETPAAPEVVAVIGLEDTPGIVPEAGAAPSRPPAIALLNHAREMLRKRLHAPLLVWCDPLTYNALTEHAPDFFDHYTALFTFLDAAPDPTFFEPLYLPFDKPGLFADLHRIDMPSHAAVAFYEEQVRHLEEPNSMRARALLGLAHALWSLRDASNLAGPPSARLALEEALKLLSPRNDTHDWSRGQILLGLMLRRSTTGDHAVNVRQAISCFRAVINTVTEAESPQLWAAAQLGLGHCWNELPTGSRRKNLRYAIDCFESSLRVYTEASYPQIWAFVQVDLAMAYKAFPSSDYESKLRQAIAHFHAALRVVNESTFPQMWAMIQMALGSVYDQLSKETLEEKGKIIQQAIACYRAALRIYKESEFPQEWALTQLGMGADYYRLTTGDRLENLQKAIECYYSALRVYTEVGQPEGWTDTMFYLGNALLELGTKTNNPDAVHRAREYLASVARHHKGTDFDKISKSAADTVRRIDAVLAVPAEMSVSGSTTE